METEIKYIKIIIIQYLPQKDQPQGKQLYENIKQLEKEDEKYSVEYYQAETKDQFLTTIEDITKKANAQTLITIHIDSHGGEDGIGILPPLNFVTWKELLSSLRPINVITNNTLTLVMSVCEGTSLIGSFDPTDRAPFMVIVANPKPITFKDMDVAFPNFYKIYRTPLDINRAINALNSSIDFSKPLAENRKKTKFETIMACQLFDEFFKPYRVPDRFLQLVDKSVEDEKERIKKAQDLWCKEGEKLKPYFNFESNERE